MKKLFKNIVLLGLIICGVNLVVHKLLLPFGWGDPTQYIKIKYFEENKSKYNAVFIGGSLEYRQINPQILDSIAHTKGIELHLFNFSIDGHNFVQQMNDYEYYLKHFGKGLDYAFLSHSSESTFFRKQLHQIKFVQWVNLKSAILGTKISMQLPMNLKNRVQYSYYYWISSLENGLVFGLGDEAARFIFYDKYHLNSAYLGKNKDGFYPYDQEESRSQLDFEWEDRLLKISHQEYLKNKTKRDSLLAQNTRQFEGLTKDRKLIKPVLEKFNQITKESNAQGIRCYYSMPPRTRTSYAILLPIFEKLPENYRFEFANPIKYPELYKVENSYNFYHLNEYGAAIYSNLVAKKWTELELANGPVKTPTEKK